MTRTSWLGLGLLVVLLVGGGVYLFGHYAVNRFVEPRLRDSLPPTVKVRDVDFKLLPLGIQLRGSEADLPTSDGTPGHLRAERISINPNWSSMFGDTVTIDSLDFEGLTLDLYPGFAARTTPPGDGADDSWWSGLLSGDAASDGSGRFLIKQLTVRGGRVRWFETPDGPEPSFVLEPVNLTVGPISPATLRRGMPVRADAGLASRPDLLALQGQFMVTDHPALTGTFHVRSLPVAHLAGWLPRALSLEEGTLDAAAPFMLGSRGVEVEGLDMVIRDGLLAFDVSGGAATRPKVPAEDTVRSRGDTEPEASDDPFPVSLGESRLRVENTRLQVSEEEPGTLDIREGTLVVGSLLPARPDVPVKGQLVFSRPDGLLEFAGSLDGTAPEFRLSDIIAQARVDRVQELNPYTRDWLPMTLKGGTFTGGVQGSMTASELDLAVEVAFGRLRAGTGKTPDSTFLGVPVSLLLKQLSEQDGTLHLGFRVTGPPQAPRVDVSAIRHRLLFRLGVDAAVLASLGLPVYVGDLVIGKVVGVSVLGEARRLLGDLTASPELDPSAVSAERKPRATEIPKKDPRTGASKRSR